ncbi:ORF959 [White spot syndrome virus]|uniref:Wsv363 n=3 Tax=White spot syndrome virus TaxID=342409 RepID=Q8VAN8_WSSVS|nr:wsv363 [Shrimp white spot syndrome virus]AFX59740.1 wsv363 [White spot syndrome virus]AAL33365.1 wsv363 [Shrimp white spot syndrome virus]AAL89290.1 WSSV422 [Shrimp white spot syndrome virus]ATU83707.1 ORF959 [White spot syndrome virus]AWQ60489.1 wsv363 [Shrimp white spot syndrome virus]
MADWRVISVMPLMILLAAFKLLSLCLPPTVFLRPCSGTRGNLKEFRALKRPSMLNTRFSCLESPLITSAYCCQAFLAAELSLKKSANLPISKP